VDDALTFADPADVTAWVAGHADEAEAWVAFERVRHPHPVAAPRYDAVAAAFADAGWVGGERRPLGDDRYAVRFAPGTVKRRKPPAWATAEGPMPEPELTREQEERFRGDAEAWAFFERQPPRYRRAATWWVTSGKSEQTRERRLEALVEASAAGEKVPAIVRGL
jgi:hypothetical protein